MDYVVRSSRRSSSSDLIQSRRGGGLTLGTVGWILHVSRLCRVWEPSQVQATKTSDVAYIIRILSLESCICVVVVYMILVIMRKIAWSLFIIEQHDSLIRLSYPCFLCSCLVLYVSFCDDHLFRWEQMWLQCQRHFWRMKSHRVSVEEEVSSGSFSSGQ